MSVTNTPTWWRRGYWITLVLWTLHVTDLSNQKDHVKMKKGLFKLVYDFHGCRRFLSRCYVRILGEGRHLIYTPLSHRPKQIPKQKRCRNRHPQAKKTLKTKSPSTPLGKFIPKQKSIKANIVKSYVPKHWLITPQANPKESGVIPLLKGLVMRIGAPNLDTSSATQESIM